MTRDKFADSITFLSAAIAREISLPTAEAWFLVASREGLTDDEFQAGVVAVVASNAFPGLPTIGAIIQAARASTGKAALSAEDRATVAWGKLLRAIKEHGAYQSVRFDDDPAIGATVGDLGGWQYLCDVPRDELLRFVRPSFCKTYCSHVRAGTSTAPAMTGLLAVDAARRGYALPAPIDAASGAPLLAVDPPPRERQPVANLAGKVGQALPLPEKFQAKPVTPKPSFDKSDVKQQLADWQASKGSADATPPADRRRKKNPAPPADHPGQHDAA